MEKQISMLAEIGKDFFKYFNENRYLWNTLFSENERLRRDYCSLKNMTFDELENAINCYIKSITQENTNA